MRSWMQISKMLMNTKKQYVKFGRTFLIVSLFLVRVLTCIGQYPDRNIRVIVHVSPGGGTDTMARLLLQFVGKTLGKTFIIENYQGAGGQVGYTTLASAAPDGYTIGTITTTSIITHELTRENVAYNLQESFVPIARIAHDPSAIFVRSDSPIMTIEDLFQEARDHPGQISCGGSMIWGTHHIHSILLKKLCSVDLNFIPFDGLAESRNNLLGGHIDVAIGGTMEYVPLLQSGDVRALAVASQRRQPHMASVPTYKEKGYPIIIGSDRGLAAPMGTPKEIIELLSSVIHEVLANHQFISRSKEMNLYDITAYLDNKEFAKYLSDLKKELLDVISNPPVNRRIFRKE